MGHIKVLLAAAVFTLMFAATGEAAEDQCGQGHAHKAANAVEALHEVTEARAVSCENKVYVSAEVAHRYRLQLPEVRKEATMALSDAFDDNISFHFSTDLKVWQLLSRLEARVNEGDITKKETIRELTAVDEHMKG
ncbi:hypothetical protein B0H94_10314 [Salsuginibacillus halophilus]|uniref:Sporulation lipoprotein YhcN/YlaJ n=1 Tax=Salsuginibacillus halophilus TaxID=517424 RepID=A0A2P8HVY6_9BACI|nr:hypothetical protein [Salsuginibacillus halophilus]PSL50403.1 hypothetical protein B0H94_10314 [Salsuginibacillus halophilus]